MEIICRKSKQRRGATTTNRTKSTSAAASQSGEATNQRAASGHVTGQEVDAGRQEVQEGETSGGGDVKQDGCARMSSPGQVLLDSQNCHI